MALPKRHAGLERLKGSFLQLLFIIARLLADTLASDELRRGALFAILILDRVQGALDLGRLLGCEQIEHGTLEHRGGRMDFAVIPEVHLRSRQMGRRSLYLGEGMDTLGTVARVPIGCAAVPVVWQVGSVGWRCELRIGCEEALVEWHMGSYVVVLEVGESTRVQKGAIVLGEVAQVAMAGVGVGVAEVAQMLVVVAVVAFVVVAAAEVAFVRVAMLGFAGVGVLVVGGAQVLVVVVRRAVVVVHVVGLAVVLVHVGHVAVVVVVVDHLAVVLVASVHDLVDGVLDDGHVDDDLFMLSANKMLGLEGSN